jgi:hypothetical protein
MPGVTTSTIEVTGSGKVFDLNLELDITHTYHRQLTATLFAPDGTPVELFSNVGGSGDNLTATVLDDQAGSAPFTDTPSGPRGTWPPSTTWPPPAPGRWKSLTTPRATPTRSTVGRSRSPPTEAPGVPGITVDSTSGLVRPPKPSLVIRRRRSPEQRATLARLDLVRSLRTGRRLWSRLVPSKRRPRMS